MTSHLTFADDCALPIAAVTETIAIVGRRGSGKTTTAVVLAEELLERGLQVLVIDPTDVWYGLKTSASGDRPGYGVVILGGRRGDLPLDARDGATIADFIVDSRASVVCSLRGFESQNDERRFVTDLARRLYYRKGQETNPTPLMVIIDEASRLVPQRVGGEDAHLVAAIQRLVRQGRSSGFGITLIDQRPASVNKDVLTQLELLICHQVTSPQDRKAIEAWIEQHDANDERDRVLKTLGTLTPGVAWFWSPGWLKMLRLVDVRNRRTFDSSRTPKPGERAVEPTTVAEIDLDALKTKLATTIERARAEDPRELRRRIAELEGLLRARQAQAPDPAALDRAREDGIRDGWSKAQGEIDRLVSAREAVFKHLLEACDVVQISKSADAAPSPMPLIRMAPELPSPPRVVDEPTPSPRPRAGDSPEITKGVQAVALAAMGLAGASRETISVLTGYKRSSRDTFIQRGVQEGWLLVQDGRVFASPRAQKLLASEPPVRRGKELHEWWLGRLPQGEAAILRIALAAHPNGISRDALSTKTGYKRSSRDTYIQHLARRFLIETTRSGLIYVSPRLME